MFEISSSLVSKKTDEGNGGLTLAGDCSPGDPDLPGSSVTGGPDFLVDVDPIESKAEKT